MRLPRACPALDGAGRGSRGWIERPTSWAFQDRGDP